MRTTMSSFWTPLTILRAPLIISFFQTLVWQNLERLRTTEKKGGREGGRTNERPGTDHVISGPMRVLEKTASHGADIQRDMATL